jgi:hypothetical protein
MKTMAWIGVVLSGLLVGYGMAVVVHRKNSASPARLASAAKITVLVSSHPVQHDETRKFAMTNGVDLVKHLKGLPYSEQRRAWDTACRQLLSEGRDWDALFVAAYCPRIAFDKGFSRPLRYVTEQLVARGNVAEHLQKLVALVNSEGGPPPGAVADLASSWAAVDPAAALDVILSIEIKGVDLSRFREETMFGAIGQNAIGVSSSSIDRVLSDSRAPAELIDRLGHALTSADPARGWAWAMSLAEPAQRREAALAVAKALAGKDHPKVWETARHLPRMEDRSNVARTWASGQLSNDPVASVAALKRVPEEFLNFAADSMITSAFLASPDKAYRISEEMRAQHIAIDPWVAVIKGTGISPDRWLNVSGDRALSRISQLPPSAQEAIAVAARSLAVGAGSGQ